MNFRSAIGVGIAGVVAMIVVITVVQGSNPEQDNILRVAHFANIGHAVPIVGIEKGIFGDGLSQTRIQPKLFDSGPQVIESLFANSVDIAYVGPGPAINGFLKSEDQNVKILAGAASGGASFIVHPNSNIESVDNFAEKKIAAPQIGNSQDVSLRYFLSENGLKPAEKGGSVIVLNVANPDIYTLFTKGDIDAAWVPEPWATILVQELDGKRLFFEEDLWPQNQFASVVLIARTDYVEQHPQVIKEWMDSHYKTVKWINENPKQTEQVFNEYLKKTLGKPLPESIVSESFSNLEITVDPLNSSIETFAERASQLGYLGRQGYSLNGIFYDINTNLDMQEVLVDEQA